MRYLILIVALCLPNFLAAKIFDETAKVSDLGEVYVYALDGAIEGCWTNINEVIEYAEGKLRLIGINTVEAKQMYPTDDQGSAFTINVSGTRMKTIDMCYGQISVAFNTVAFGAMNRNLYGLLQYSNFATTVVSGDNFNKAVIEAVRQAVEEWEDRQ